MCSGYSGKLNSEWGKGTEKQIRKINPCCFHALISRFYGSLRSRLDSISDLGCYHVGAFPRKRHSDTPAPQKWSN